MNQLLPVLDSITPQVVWGLFPRLLGLVYLVAIGSLYGQVLPLAGSRGVRPVKLQLRKIRADYPSIKRFLYFPTLLWLSAEDWFLRALVVTGIGASLLAMYGGALSGWALLICWLVYLSLDLALGLAYPWDSLLLEAGFLAIFLPPLKPLPDISTAVLPLPTLAWAFRWLLFRLLFGFGKFKFLGTHRKEMAYLKGFLINQPLPTYLGWYAHHLPLWVIKAALVYLFLVEMIVPFLIFIPGDIRILAALAITGLMIGIQLTGNFGFFNIVVITLCVTLLDRSATIFNVFNQPLVELVYPVGNLLTNGVVLAVFIGGLVYLPFNSWCAQSWLYWPFVLELRQRWLKRLLGFYRSLAPFRIVHSYGVFPPISSPAMRWIPILEGTQDGKVWKAYRYRFMTSGPTSRPGFVAPYHPRHDHSVFYEAFGTNLATFVESTFGIGNPYLFSHSSGMECLIQRLLEGNSPVVNLFGHNPFPDKPPIAIRVNCYAFQPTSHAERLRTGAWWRQRYVGPHLPAMSLDSQVWERLFPDPELFHWDQIIWKRRSDELRGLMTLANGDSKSVSLGAGIAATDVECFWQDFVVFVGRVDQQDWRNLPETVQNVRQRYSRPQLQAFEKIIGRLSLVLLARLEPYFFGEQTPKIEVESFFHLGLLIHYIIGQGQTAYEHMLNNPADAAQLAGQMTLESGLLYTGIFRYKLLVYHARKARLVQRITPTDYAPGLPGFLALIPFLTQQFEVEGEEDLPSFARTIADGVWYVVEG